MSRQQRHQSDTDDDATRYLDPDHPSKPSGPTKLTKPTWWGVLKRSIKAFKGDNCTDWGAALTYYGILSLFPAVIVLVSLAGVFSDGEQTVATLLNLAEDIGAGQATDGLEGPIREITQQRNAAGFALVFGLLAALWSASAYIGAFTRAMNAIYGVEEGRPFYKLRPLQVLMTLAALIMVTVVAVGLVVSGPVAKAVGEAIGLGETLVTVWDIAKWPILLAIVCLLISLLYWASPNVKQPRFRWFTVGGTFALVVLILASAGFGLYVANFGSYNKTYGSLAGAIIFLIWLYIANCVILLGAEINVELERGRELQAGQPAEEDILLPRRDPKDDEEPEPIRRARRAEEERTK